MSAMELKPANPSETERVASSPTATAQKVEAASPELGPSAGHHGKLMISEGPQEQVSISRSVESGVAKTKQPPPGGRIVRNGSIAAVAKIPCPCQVLNFLTPSISNSCRSALGRLRTFS